MSKTIVENAEFGYIDTLKNTYHKGIIGPDGEMYFKAKGEPTSHLKSEIIEKTGWISGPKWAGVKEWLKKSSFNFKVELKLEEDKGWIFSTVYYTIKGEKRSVEMFDSYIKKSIDKYVR